MGEGGKVALHLLSHHALRGGDERVVHEEAPVARHARVAPESVGLQRTAVGVEGVDDGRGGRQVEVVGVFVAHAVHQLYERPKRVTMRHHHHVLSGQ